MVKRSIIGYLVCFLFISMISFAASAQKQQADESKQIIFIENSWNEALKQAAAQNKYIFVDAYASWCGPCKMLRLTTFKNSKAALFYNKNLSIFLLIWKKVRALNLLPSGVCRLILHSLYSILKANPYWAQ